MAKRMTYWNGLWEKISLTSATPIKQKPPKHLLSLRNAC